VTDAADKVAAISGELRHTVIKPPSRWAPIRFGEVWAFRDLLRRLTIRDLKLRYKQTALGVIWVVLQPLLAAGILSFVFGTVANLPSDGVPYFVFAYVGMMCWTLFSQCVTKMSSSLTGNAALVSKTFFPRLVLPFSTVGSSLIDFCVSLVMGVVVIALGGVAPGWGLVTLPFWVALALLLAAGAGLGCGALAVQYRDISQILPVFMQLLLYATPIAYALSAVPKSLQRLVELNPLTGIITGFRWAAIDTTAPSVAATAWSATAAVTLFVIGAFVFTRREQKFADVI
jgi:lipopolysaccharide transport system permease protein